MSFLSRALRKGNDRKPKVAAQPDDDAHPARDKQITIAVREDDVDVFRSMAKAQHGATLSSLVYGFLLILAVRGGLLPKSRLPPREEMPDVLQRMRKSELDE